MKILLLWLTIIIICHEQWQMGFSFSNKLCHPEQEQWLLELKQLVPPEPVFEIHPRCGERPDNYYKPMSWNNSYDCCVWDGVTCDESTGDVIGLDLGCSGLAGDIHSNSSLFHLTHLRKLNLAYNSFVGSQISFNFGRLNRLTHLNLSVSGFEGRIPVEFYHLSNLVSLDLHSDPHDPVITLDIKLLFQNMTKISVLSLVYVNISSEMPMNMSSFLTYVDLSATGLYGKFPESIFESPNLEFLNLLLNDGLVGSLPSFNKSNVGSIKELILTGMNLSGRLPDSLGFMVNLNYLMLSGCRFSGSIPESIGNLTEIIEMDLSSNNFSGRLPFTISSLQHLTHFDLSNNHFQGEIPDAFSNFQKLTQILFYNNSFVGPIPSSITNMSRLESLQIHSNALTGPFPSRAAGGLQTLLDIGLSKNLIAGTIPSWLLALPSLMDLDLSSNRLVGRIEKFQSKNLSSLDLSNNKLTLDLESFSNLSEIGSILISHNRVTTGARESANVSLPKLNYLQMSSCEIEEFPMFLRNLPNLQLLDLSDNKIHGPIPSWFRSIQWNWLEYLYVSMNHLTDHVGYLPWDLVNLDLHSNSLRGTFSSSICNMSKLVNLDLSHNKLSGKIPECIGNSSFSLMFLDLRRNEFHGTIPTTFGVGVDGNSLSFLSLNGNHMEGPLPLSLVNCTNLEVLDVGNNMIRDTFPWWLQTLFQLQVLILRSNRFHGSISPPVVSSNNSFTTLRILDVSYNYFNGVLPDKLFGNLQAMKNQSIIYGLYMGSEGNAYKYSVELSVKGQDVELTRILTVFTTVDLSSNNFHGGIPESLAYLHSLRLLNLSHNKINGTVPSGLGLLANLEQLDLSSNQLIGSIPWTLTNLTFLAVLNLSYNHLVGHIPQGKQFSTFSNESYVGNSELCGVPLTRACENNTAPGPPSPAAVHEEDESGLMMGFTWQAVVMGYGVGIIFGFVIGNLMFYIGKPKWFVRIFNIEAANRLKRSNRTRRA